MRNNRGDERKMVPPSVVKVVRFASHLERTLGLDEFRLGEMGLGLFKLGLGSNSLACLILHNWASTNNIVGFIRWSPVRVSSIKMLHISHSNLLCWIKAH